MAFLDLEKAFNRVPREIVWWALRVMGVDERIVKAIQAMYEGATTAVTLRDGESKEFEVKSGSTRGSIWKSTFIYHCPGSTVPIEFRLGLPWELLYADDLDRIPKSTPMI